MKSLILIMFFIVCAQVAFADCGEWINEDARTQGGGFVWFPGKASATSMDEALNLARGRSLEYMQNECNAIPHGSRFVERCVQNEGRVFNVYTRVSATHEQCSSAKKYPSRSLTPVLQAYQMRSVHKRMNHNACNRWDIYDCLELGIEAHRKGDIPLSVAYLSVSCQKMEAVSCTFLGLYQHDMGNHAGAKFTLEKACELKHPYGCRVLASIRKLI